MFVPLARRSRATARTPRAGAPAVGRPGTNGPEQAGRSGSMTSAADPCQRWLRRLSGYCWRSPRLVPLALGGSLVATIVAVIIPLIQRDIVNNAILTQRQPIWLGAMALIVAALVNFAGVFTRRYLGGRLSLDVQHDLRTEMFASLSRLDGARQDQLHTGQVVTRSISDVNMGQSVLAMVPFMLGNILLFFLSL